MCDPASSVALCRGQRAAPDGLLIPSVVVGRWVGAEPGAKVMLILGSANQFGEGFSMATGAYLSSKSQREYCDREQAHEKGELDQFPGGTPGGVRLPMRPTLQ